MEDSNEVLSGFLERLIELGLPVDRAVSAIEALHSEYAGIGRFWTREEGTVVRYLPHGDRREAIYQTSPFAYVNRTGEWLILDLAETPDDLFPIIPELKEAGYRHYVTIPIRFTNGAENAISFATRSPEGFGTRELTILRMVIPSFALVTELRATSNRLDEVLRIYVGDDPHKAILSGAIQRGQVTRIRSAILFADMRDYTHISSTLSPESAVELLNNYFDCLVPPIEDEGGEVLKYLGDGLLAIVRDKGDDTGGAAQSALTAATKALAPHRGRQQRRPLSRADQCRLRAASRRCRLRQCRLRPAPGFHGDRARRESGEPHRRSEQEPRRAAAHVEALRRAPVGQSLAARRARSPRFRRGDRSLQAVDAPRRSRRLRLLGAVLQ